MAGHWGTCGVAPEGVYSDPKRGGACLPCPCTNLLERAVAPPGRRPRLVL